MSRPESMPSAAAPTRPGVIDALARLSDAINQLSDRVADMGVRLEPVLLGASPTTTDSEAPDVPSVCDAHHSIRSMIERVEEITNRVIDLRGRLDL